MTEVAAIRDAGRRGCVVAGAFRRAAVGIGLVAALVLGSGCTMTGSDGRGTADGLDPAAVAVLERIREQPLEQAGVDALGEVFDDADIAVADSFEASDPDSDPGPDPDATIVVSQWQLQSMTAEVANGGGISGAELEQVAPAPAGAPPVAYLVAAWASVYDSTAARFARAVLGDAELHRADRVLFPQAVLSLFLADAVAADDEGLRDEGLRDEGAPDAGTPAGPVLAEASAMRALALPAADLRQAEASGPCTAVTSFVHRAIDSVAEVLKVRAGSGFFGFLGKIWNTAIDLATGFVKGLIDVVTRPIVALMVDVFAVVAIVQQVSTFLTVWRVALEPEPRETRFGVGDEVVVGAARLSVRNSRFEPPALLVDCARAVGVDLAKAGSAQGSRLSWDASNDPRPDLTTRRSADPALDEREQARYEYATGQETPKQAKGVEQGGMLHLIVHVHRNDLEAVRRLLARILLDQIPATIRPLVEGFASRVLEETTTQLAWLGDVRGTSYTWVTFHAPREDAPSKAKPGEKSEPCGVNGVAPGRYVGEASPDPARTMHDAWEVTVGADGTLAGVKTSTNEVLDYRVEQRYSGTVAAPVVTITVAEGDAAIFDVGTTVEPGPYSGDCTSLVLTDEVADVESMAPVRLELQ